MTTSLKDQAEAAAEQVRKEVHDRNVAAKEKDEREAREAIRAVFGREPDALEKQVVLYSDRGAAYPDRQLIATVDGMSFAIGGGESYNGVRRWHVRLVKECDHCGTRFVSRTLISPDWNVSNIDDDRVIRKLGESLAADEYMHHCREAEIKSIAYAIRTAATMLKGESAQALAQAALERVYS